MEFDAEVRDIIIETADTKTLRLDRPADFNFVPGQFVNVTLHTPDAGRVRRAYSIASSPQDAPLDLTVRQLPDGFVSKILTEKITVGQKLNLRGPYGRFVLEDRRLVWIAGGSGIVPFRSMWRHIDQTSRAAEFTLLYATKTAGQIIFRAELEALSQSGKNIFHTFTAEAPAGWRGFRGRIDRQMLSAVVPHFNGPLFYVCGPPAMCDDVARVLVELGVPRLNIRTEKYD
jgi:ferredoxin-NADP reductase